METFYQRKISSMLEELEDMLGQMEDPDERFIEEMLQKELETPEEFTLAELDRIQSIYDEFLG